MQTLNLTGHEKEAIDNLAKTVKSEWPLSKFKVFGSKTKGTADEESDLDILILLPCTVTDEIRRRIVHMVFEINLEYGSNISALIVSEQEWKDAPLSLLPIHSFVEEEGIPV